VAVPSGYGGTTTTIMIKGQSKTQMRMKMQMEMQKLMQTQM
jgi:hypothetical protein